MRIDVKKMSPSERVEALETIWESLLHDETEIKTPDWHKDVLENRKKLIESGQVEFISIDKLKASRKT
jgi:putative addiction module component (TIGR02574 family)